MKGLVNVHVEVAQVDCNRRFLHTVAEGPSDDSYGVQVAALAGLPRQVVERASDLLAFLEAQAGGAKAGQDGTPSSREQGQASLMGYFAAAAMGATSVAEQPITPPEEAHVLQALRELNVDDLTPRQALEAVYALKLKLEGGA